MQELVNLLLKKSYTISLAESCTGGMMASRIVDISDASRVLKCSFVTYCEDAKEKYAHVKKETIEKYGVVSEEVALEMAKGIRIEAKSNIGVGITGSAGPSSYPGIEIGTVCFGISFGDKEYYFKEVFKNKTRNIVREEAVQFITQKLIDLLK